MSEILLDTFIFKITYVHPDGCHVIGLRKLDKKVVFLNVAHADQSCVGKIVDISSARTLGESECPPKFYTPYGIMDPYEHGWKFQKLITHSVTYGQRPPFRPIPLSRAEIRENAIFNMKVGTKWSNGKQTWIIKDTHMEKLAGQEKLRVWVTDQDGNRGQALYADSIINAYKLVPIPDTRTCL
jgi:hypothetical protein